MKSKLTVSPAIKITLGISIAIALSAMELERWKQSKHEEIDDTPWTLVSAESGNRLTLTRNNEIKTISLCGVDTKGEIAKNYLQMVLDKRDGEVVLEDSGDAYEA